jgi:hypothetical protein
MGEARAVLDMTEQTGCCAFLESVVVPSRKPAWHEFSCDFSATARERSKYVDKAATELSPFGPQTAIVANLFFNADVVCADTLRLAFPLRKYSPGNDADNAKRVQQTIHSSVSRCSRLFGVPTREECKELGIQWIPRPFSRQPQGQWQGVKLAVPGTFRSAPMHLPTLAHISGRHSHTCKRDSVQSGLMRSAYRFLLAQHERALTQFNKQTGIYISREW